jgi:hypothetical protein
MTTAILNLSLLASFLFCPVPAGAVGDLGGCMPSAIDLNSVIVVEDYKATRNKPVSQTTIKQRLSQLKARCKRGKLVDGKGKQIYFYSLIGCWGNPPADYLERLQHQAQEIQRLKKRYTVIQIPCAQSVDPRKIM